LLYIYPHGAIAMRWKWILSIVALLFGALIIMVYVILSSYNFNDLKPRISQAVKDATGRDLTLGGNIELEIGFTPALVVKDLSLQNAPWGSRPEMIKIKRFKVQVALLPLISRNIRVKQFILAEPDILVETDNSGKSNFEFESAKKDELPAKESKLLALSFNRVHIEKGCLIYKDGQSGKTYALTLDSLTTTSPSTDSPVRLDFKGAYNGNPFEVAGTLGTLIPLTDPNKAWPLKLTAKANGATVTIDGGIRDAMNAKGFTFNVTAEGRSIPNIAQLADVTGVPDVGPFKVSGRLNDPAVKTYKVSNLKVTIGDSDLGGLAEISLVGERPRLTAMLSSERLDLRPFLPERKKMGKPEAKPAKPPKKAKKVFSDDPLPVVALEQVEGTAKIQAGQILLPRLAVNDLQADIVLKGGHLIVKSIKASIGGSTLNGRITVQSRDKAAAISTQLKGRMFDLGSMLKELDITDVVEGNLNVDIDLKALGRSVAALMAGLDGHTTIIMSNGRINNKYIDLLGADFSAGVYRLFNPVKEKADYTEINCLVSRFDIDKGFAESTALVFDTDRMSVVGQGKIDLKTEKLDLSLKPSSKQGVGSSSIGKLSLSLGELAKPFKLGGTIAEPSLALDPTQAAITLGKAIGGTVLFGPVGIAAALISRSSGDENPCLAAIEAAEKGVRVSGEKKKPVGKNSEVEKSTESDTKGIKDAVEDIGGKLKGLFGK